MAKLGILAIQAGAATASGDEGVDGFLEVSQDERAIGSKDMLAISPSISESPSGRRSSMEGDYDIFFGFDEGFGRQTRAGQCFSPRFGEAESVMCAVDDAQIYHARTFGVA